MHGLKMINGLSLMIEKFISTTPKKAFYDLLDFIFEFYCRLWNDPFSHSKLKRIFGVEQVFFNTVVHLYPQISEHVSISLRT